MGIGLVIIEKTYAGETWSNTHAFSTGGDLELSDADVIAAGWPLVQDGEDADFGGTGYNGATATFIQSIVAFERLMTYAPIMFSKIYVTDAKIKDLALTNTFAVAAINLPGLLTLDAASASELNIVVGTVCLQINRVPAAMSHRQGRMLLRATLNDQEVRFQNKGGVAWTSAPIAASVAARASTAMFTSGIGNHFQQNSSGLVYAIPQYSRKTSETDPTIEGQIIGAVAIGGLTVVGPMSRQMKRGKKRKKVTA